MIDLNDKSQALPKPKTLDELFTIVIKDIDEFCKEVEKFEDVSTSLTFKLAIMSDSFKRFINVVNLERQNKPKIIPKLNVIPSVTTENV